MPDIPNVLVVDDDPEICKYLEDILSRKPYKITVADCGGEAIKRVNRTSFDLVLLDLSLPDMEGYKVMDHIKRKSPDSLVIIITGFASIESAIKALRKGAYDYIRKPFEQQELLTTTENALENKRLRDSRKESEVALRESEERFRNLVENSLIGICIIQEDKIVYHNREQGHLLGKLPDSYQITKFEFLHPDDLAKVQRLYKGMRSGKIKTAETDFRFSPSCKFSDQADIKWVQCHASVFNYQGKESILVNMMDVSRAKELEYLIMIKHKMASLGRVAAGIAHEIRNPLTGINSYLYTLEDLCDNDTFSPESIKMIKKIAGQIQTASNKIESVIKRVLDFSKPGTPKMIKINLNQSLSEAIDLSTATLRKKGIKIETSLADNLPECYGDEHLMEQVILNLINNATQIMNEKDDNKMIKVTSHFEKQSLFIRVADSGPGVPLKLRERIFDPFFTTHQDGSGIGLSLAQRIVADHGGTITVGSSEWGGAEFSIELPIEKRIGPR
ncbi:MAG: response regulator [Thermodesulfobacteriota bacterium]|nr:response regulator [Thermodesulfobacteriota bacterium]